MKRGLDRVTQSSVVGNGKERDTASSTAIMSPSSYCNTSDAISGSNNSQDCNSGGGCCMGGWVNSLLGGGGEGQDPLTRAAATNTTTNDDPTTLVVEELNKLSVKERENVYEDLHGVSMIDDESNQELVNKRLNDMKVQLDTKIPRSKKVAYLIAMEEFGDIGKEYCQDRSLHVMFLRADRWDSKKAAIRFVGWLNFKLELFGRDVLCHRHITLDKLEKDTIKTMKAGSFQILPQRDTSGRTIIFDNIGQQSKCLHSVKSMLQQFWYMLMATVEDDIQAQRMGIVGILYTIGGSLSFSGDSRIKYLYEASRMAPFLPIRINSLHCCFNDPNLGPVISMIQKGIGSHIRARFRIHEGKHTEVQYSLMSYGMPADVLPVTTDGNIQKSYHLKWCKRRKARDTSHFTMLANRGAGGNCDSCKHDDVYGIDLPGRFDVLLGKGPTIRQHMGNRRLQELVSIYYQEYDTALHGDKQLVAEKIIRLVTDHFTAGGQQGHKSLIADNIVINYDVVPPSDGEGGKEGEGVVVPTRFLKQRDDGWWEPVTHKEAIDKVCHTFRAYRLSNAAKNSNARTTSTPTVASGVVGKITNERVASSSSTSSTSSSTIGRSGEITATTKRIKVGTTEDELLVDLDDFEW